MDKPYRRRDLMIRISLILLIAIILLQAPSLSSMKDAEINVSDNPPKTTHNPLFPATSMPDSDWWHALWPNPKNIISALNIKQGAVSIDLCCGDGYFTFPLAETSSKVYGIELEADLLEQAKKEAETQKITNCIWIQGDAMKLTKIVPEPVDFVLIANTFHGIPDKENLSKSILSILKPQGELAIINWHKKPREETVVLGLPRGPKSEMRMSPKEVENILLPLGFVLKSCVEFPPYHYGSIFKKS